MVSALDRRVRVLERECPAEAMVIVVRFVGTGEPKPLSALRWCTQQWQRYRWEDEEGFVNRVMEDLPTTGIQLLIEDLIVNRK